jgi:hypothetical protein
MAENKTIRLACNTEQKQTMRLLAVGSFGDSMSASLSLTAVQSKYSVSR